MFRITLAAARVNAGLKQKDAAKKLGVTEKTLGGYERGQVIIPAYRLRQISKIYGIPSDYIKLPNIEDGEYDEQKIL